MFAQAGERISDYEVLKLLGRGSFGVVLLVKDSRWQELALKLVPCDHLDDRDAAHAAATTLAEAQLLQRLRHPQIVSCYDVQFDPSRKCVWLALEFMDGGDLGNHIKARRLHSQPPFSGPFQQRVLSMVGSALHYIHSQGVLHRDVKPPNLLVDRDMQQVKLADFGVSKILEASGFAGTVLGTPAYHPPELVSGKPYGRPADAWALGICLYELASLQRPFDASNQLALVWQIVEHQPAALPPETPNDIVDIIRGLLQKDPEQRLRLEDLGFTMEASHIEPGGSDPDAPDAAKPCPTWSISDCSGVHEAVPEAGYDQGLRKVISDEQVPTPPVAPISLQHLATEGSDLEEVILNDAPISPTTPRLRTEGLTAFAERSPTTPRRNWLSRLGRGLRYGVLGASARDEAVVSVFNEGEVAD